MSSILKDLAGKGFIYGIGSSLNGLVGFILIPFYVSKLKAVEYGQFALAEMLLSLMLVVLGLGLNVSLLSRYSKMDSNQRQHLTDSIFTLLLISTFCIEALYLVIIFIGGKSIFPGLNNSIFIVIALITLVENIWMFFATLFRAQGSAWLYICASLIQVSCGLLATVVLITKFGFRDEGILYGRLIGDIILLLFLSPQFPKLSLRIDVNSAISILKIGLPLVPATFASMWIIMSPRYFIEWFGTPADVGVFAMSSKIAGLVSMGFIQPFAMAWMVSLFKIYKRDDAQQVYATVLTYFILVGGGLALLLGISSPQIVALLGKDNFPLSSGIISIMALSNIASGLIYPLNIGPYVKEVTYKVIPVYATSTAFATLLTGLLSYKYSMIGACSAILLTYLMHSYLLMRLSDKLYPIKRDILRNIKVVFSLSAAYFICAWIQNYLPTYFKYFSPAIFIFIVTALLFLLRFFKQGEVQTIKRIICFKKVTV